MYRKTSDFISHNTTIDATGFRHVFGAFSGDWSGDEPASRVFDGLAIEFASGRSRGSAKPAVERLHASIKGAAGGFDWLPAAGRTERVAGVLITAHVVPDAPYHPFYELDPSS